MSAETRSVEYSTTHKAVIQDQPIPDIDATDGFADLFARTRNYTMTSKEIMFSTFQAAQYVARRNIPGDLVECGVWRGGSALLAALTLRETPPGPARFPGFGRKRRRTWLYDTFTGMTAPTDQDVDLIGGRAADYMAAHGDDGRWCYANEADVRAVFAAEGFTKKDIKLIKGDVCETLKEKRPKRISLLRLDTDWYESTKAELELLYPLLSPGGVLIIDDYGHWQGAREAVDEYFSTHPAPLLHRIGYAVRVAIKV